MSAEAVAETHPFQAEVAELLRLMVHAVYSETDVFLRELISNASDACDKLRYEAIANQSLLGEGAPLAIRITPEPKKYLEPTEIERIVHTYSEHILFPIELVVKEGEPRQVNSASALWQRAKSDLKPDDYAQAYRSIAGAFDEPALTIHYKAEGRQSYAVLLFVPSRPPFDLSDPGHTSRVKLYVRRVFITDESALLPAHLRFVRGVV